MPELQQGQDAKGKVRILIVDDHPALREGLAANINLEPDLEVCAEAGDVAGAVEAMCKTTPGLVIVDITLGTVSGLSLIEQIRARDRDIPILVFSMHTEPVYAERALAAGASGYVTKDESCATILEAIRRVVNGGIFVSDKLASTMFRCFQTGTGAKTSSLLDLLTAREFEVFHMIGRGLTARAVAQHLSISVKTVNTHRENIRKKLGLRNAVELAHAAISWVQAQKRP
jgi:DNA-binding NarL/FixJ family response regulator